MYYLFLYFILFCFILKYLFLCCLCDYDEEGRKLKQQAFFKHTIILFLALPKFLRKHCFKFLLGRLLVPREIENNAYAKFWRDSKEYCGIFEKGLFIGAIKFQFISNFVRLFKPFNVPDTQGFFALNGQGPRPC